MTSTPTDAARPSPVGAAQRPAHRTAHRICPLCEACCGLEIKLERQAGTDTNSGREHIVSIKGHAEDVFSHGYLCPKAVALKDLHDDPDRLRTPLIKRNGVFVEASWDEAFAEIAARLGAIQQQHGRNAVAITLGNPIVHKLGLGLAVPRLVKALGTKNMYSASTLDQIPRQLVCGWMYGHWLSVPVPDIDHSHWLLVIGANPLASNGSMWTVPDFRHRARALQARGGKLIVIDPRRTETAAVADEHLVIRPGGDAFLLAAMARQLFEDGLVRLGAAEAHVAGLDTLPAALAPFTPELAAARCGIPAATIVRLAHELAAAPRAVVYGRIGTNTQSYGSLSAWLIDLLNILTGRLDAPGGLMFPKAAAFAANTQGAPGQGRGIVTGRYASRVSQAPEVMSEFPITCLAEEIATPGEGQVRALVTIASNPVLSAPGSARLDAALATLDFMVSVDIYVNETTRHADVILPGRSPLEDGHYDLAFSQLSTRNQARYSAPVFSGRDASGQPSEWAILNRLATIAQGRPAPGWAEVDAADDALLAQEVGKLAAQFAQAQAATIGAPSAEALTARVLAALKNKSGAERWLDLALRTGPYGDLFGLKPQGLSLDKLAAAPAGIDLGALQPRLPEALRTPSGKVELAPPPLVADLARAAADLHTPAPELVVIGRRDTRSNNSWMHNLPTLAKGPFRGALQLNPADAARLGLAEGARAHLVNASAGRDAHERQVTVNVTLDAGLPPGVCCLPHGWGHDLPGIRLGVAAQRPGANLNAVLDETLRDPLSGNAVLSGVAVTLTPL
ncbi:MAG: hypothetical protein RIQ60_167 [Pseudomonadota bacterium]|jgi:anaerobic selenocysteine-containing dehydrogenase